MERRRLLWYGISALVALIVVGINLYSEPYVLSRHEMSGLIGKVPCQVASGPDPDCPNTTCYKDGDYWVQRVARFYHVTCSAPLRRNTVASSWIVTPGGLQIRSSGGRYFRNKRRIWFILDESNMNVIDPDHRLRDRIACEADRNITVFLVPYRRAPYFEDRSSDVR